MSYVQTKSITSVYLNLEDASQGQLDHVRETIEALFLGGVFNVRRGTVTLHFDAEGTLAAIDKNEHVWMKKGMGGNIAKLVDNVKVSVK